MAGTANHTGSSTYIWAKVQSVIGDGTNANRGALANGLGPITFNENIPDGAIANSIVPKFTIIIGNSNGAGNYAMCGKAFDPRLIFSWPGSKIAVMGGEQAAQVLLQIEKSKRKKEGEKMNLKKESALLNEIKSRYEKQTQAYYAAARLWTDAIIDPLETRKWISIGIEAANNAPIEKKFNMGLIQV